MSLPSVASMNLQQGRDNFWKIEFIQTSVSVKICEIKLWYIAMQISFPPEVHIWFITMECLSDLIRNAQVDNVTVHLPFQPTITKACLNINGHHIIMSKEKEEIVKVRTNLRRNNLVDSNWYKAPLI